MPAIITSRTRSLYDRPPDPPWVPNTASWQWQGLAAWWPLGDGPATCGDYAGRGLQYPLTRAGTFGRKPFFGGGAAYANAGTMANYLVGSPPVTAVPLTLACWFNVVDVTSFMNLVVLNRSGSGDHYFTLCAGGSISGDPVYGEAANNSAFLGVQSSTGYTANTWRHGCVVFAANDARAAYLDGGNKGTSAASMTAPAAINQTVIGEYRGGGDPTGSGPLNGAMGDARVYRIALTDPQVRALYDPNTRFELYHRTGAKVYSFSAPAPPAGTFTKVAGSGGLAGVGGTIVGPGGLVG
jgi:hypothetical protein